jgi:hypothetical protein
MAKRVRRPGGGRKPKGPIRNKLETFSTRITAQTRQALDREAKETGQSVSQVAERLLWTGLEARSRGRSMQPIRALSFLFERLALAACGANNYRMRGFLEYRVNHWRVDPFAFGAFKVAARMLLDYLEPEGPPISMFDPKRMRADLKDAGISEDKYRSTVGRFYESPEVHGAYIFSWLLQELSHREPPSKFGLNPRIQTEATTADFYGFQDARRDLGIDILETSE